MSTNTKTSFRIFLKAYNSRVLTICSHLLEKEIERLDQNYGLKTIIKGPIRLPVKKRYYSLLRSPHIDRGFSRAICKYVGTSGFLMLKYLKKLISIF